MALLVLEDSIFDYSKIVHVKQNETFFIHVKHCHLTVYLHLMDVLACHASGQGFVPGHGQRF